MQSKEINKEDCPHFEKSLKVVASDKSKCEACDIHEHLRLCTTCGSVNCCESGMGHNTEHFKHTGHAIIKSLDTGRDFTWCYKCNAYLI